MQPNAILLAGTKSMQKCLLLAEGYGRRQLSMASRDSSGDEPARCMGPCRTDLNMGCQDYTDEISCHRQLRTGLWLFCRLFRQAELLLVWMHSKACSGVPTKWDPAEVMLVVGRSLEAAVLFED